MDRPGRGGLVLPGRRRQLGAEVNAGPGPVTGFAGLGLPGALLEALGELGYESPSPIQAATIPVLLAGRDLVGQAQTGTGKTAAFALPILARLDPARALPQALVLTPTRELAIQVAEAFQRYARHVPGFHVLPIYGGQAFGPQLGGLRRGAHVVVGTPGRIIDHLERGTLQLAGLGCLVLDEGDEMLRMGFIDDVERVLQQAPPGRQVALFSATMPAAIRRIAARYLQDPAEVTIRSSTTTTANTRQRWWLVGGVDKLEALTRILEAETFDAMIIFARTKVATTELAERLEARGFAAEALNGDMAQAQRERTIARLRGGELDILVATDVAARGLDVERVSHVLNYDIPLDTEAYVHRIGRTGRAGRKGEAILFVTPRERHLLRAIERATRQPIEPMVLPTVAAVQDQRVLRFRQKITEALAGGDLTILREVIAQYERDHGVPALDIAAALARLVQGTATPLEAPPAARHPAPPPPARTDAPGRPPGGPPVPGQRPGGSPYERATRPRRPDAPGLARYRLAVGRAHGVRPGNIVGAIANEAGLASKSIGRVEIREEYSLIELPADLAPEVIRHLQSVWVAGQQLRLRPEQGPAEPRSLLQARRDGPGGRHRAGGPDPGPRRPGIRAPRRDRSRPPTGGPGEGPAPGKVIRGKPPRPRATGPRPGGPGPAGLRPGGSRAGGGPPDRRAGRTGARRRPPRA